MSTRPSTPRRAATLLAALLVLLAATSARPEPASAARCLTAGLGDRTWVSVSTPSVRIWAKANRPADVRRARALAAVAQTKIYARFRTLLGRPTVSDHRVRCPHGKDGRLDIYLSPGGRYAGGSRRLPAGTAAAYRPYSGKPCEPRRPGFVVARPNVGNWILAHEIYHAFQAAFPRLTDCLDYSEWDEATATWAGDDAFPKDQTEHGHRSAMTSPRFHVTAPFGYRAWIYPYALSKVHGRSVMRRLELAAGSTRAKWHVDVATPGGLAAFWPTFSLLTWNQAPLAGAGGSVDVLGHGAISYRKWDRFAPVPSDPPVTPKPLSLDGASSREIEVPLTPASGGESYVNALGRHFVRFTVPDAKVRQITLKPELFGGSPTVAAFIRTADGAWRTEDWSNRASIRLCRDLAQENVTELIVAFGNAAPTIEEQASGVPKVQLRNVCGFPQTLSGTFSGSVSTPSFTLTWNGTLTKTHVANDPNTGFPYRSAMMYRTTQASLSWQVSGSCSGAGSLSGADLIDGPYPESQIDLDETPGKGWGYQVALFPADSAHMPYTCGPTSGDAIGLVGAFGEGALLYNSDTRGPETNRFSKDLATFAGSLSINAGNPQTWTWNLAGAGMVQPPD